MEQEIYVDPYDPILQDSIIQTLLAKLLAPERKAVSSIAEPVTGHDSVSLFEDAPRPPRQLVFFEVLRISNGKLSCLQALTSPSTWSLFTIPGLNQKLTIATSDLRQLLFDHSNITCRSMGTITSIKAGIEKKLLLDHVVIDF